MATVFEKNGRHQEPVVSFFNFMDIADDTQTSSTLPWRNSF